MMKLNKPRQLQRVAEFPDLRRDEHTGMIVNINKQKNTQKLEIENLKKEVSDMKGMLQKILEKVSDA